MQKIKHIIFDFGGVFLDLNKSGMGVPTQLSKIFNIPIDVADKFWNENKEELLVGEETPKEFLIKVITFLDFKIDPDMALSYWENLAEVKESHINWDVVELAQELGKKYEIHILSDTIDVKRKTDIIQKIHEKFRKVFQSHETGFKKPDAEAFLNALSKINAKPEECIFIDDVKANVDAAVKLGIHSILFESYEKLKKELSEIIN